MDQNRKEHQKASQFLIMRLPGLQKVIFARTVDNQYRKMVRFTDLQQEVLLQPLAEQ